MGGHVASSDRFQVLRYVLRTRLDLHMVGSADDLFTASIPMSSVLKGGAKRRETHMAKRTRKDGTVRCSKVKSSTLGRQAKVH